MLSILSDCCVHMLVCHALQSVNKTHSRLKRTISVLYCPFKGHSIKAKLLFLSILPDLSVQSGLVYLVWCKDRSKGSQSAPVGIPLIRPGYKSIFTFRYPVVLLRTTVCMYFCVWVYVCWWSWCYWKTFLVRLRSQRKTTGKSH